MLRSGQRAHPGRGTVKLDERKKNISHAKRILEREYIYKKAKDSL